MVLRACIVWVGLAVLAVLNAGLREGVWAPRFGQQAGHVVSTVLLCVLILFVAHLATGWIGVDSQSSAIQVGVAWTVLTLAFEFIAGHYVFGNPWEKILADYNMFRGRIWLFVPLTTLLAPYVAFVRGNSD
jgi:hypothetical protein